MKKFKTTYVLAGVLILLAAYVYIVEFKLSKKKEIEKEKAQKVLSVEKDEIEAVTLKNEYGEFFAKRVGEGKWFLEKPLKVPADAWVWDNIVKAVIDTKSKRVLEDAGDLEPFGLKTPKVTVDLHLKNNTKRSLYVGDDNPIGDSVFVTTDDKKKVVLAERYSVSDLKKTLKDVREKKLFQFEDKKTTTIDIFKKGKKFVSFQKENGKWIFHSRNKKEADAKKISDLLNAINFLEVKEFESEAPKDLKTYGLSAPQTKIILRSEKSPQLELELGTHKDKDNFVYAKKSHEKPVYRVRDGIVERLPKTLKDFEGSLTQKKEEKSSPGSEKH